jgi:hypothetical protein
LFGPFAADESVVLTEDDNGSLRDLRKSFLDPVGESRARNRQQVCEPRGRIVSCRHRNQRKRLALRIA